MLRLFMLVICSVLLGVPAPARLGETLSRLKERYGKPQPQVRKDAATWFFETETEKQLALAVTFNAKGESIAEGLKPLRYARLSEEAAQAFIDLQLQPYSGSATLRHPQPGEKYAFAGKVFTCGEHEVVYVDDANRLLLVWTQGDPASVIVLRPEMVP